MVRASLRHANPLLSRRVAHVRQATRRRLIAVDDGYVGYGSSGRMGGEEGREMLLRRRGERWRGKRSGGALLDVLVAVHDV